MRSPDEDIDIIPRIINRRMAGDENTGRTTTRPAASKVKNPPGHEERLAELIRAEEQRAQVEAAKERARRGE